jgi:hypothetical protein
MRHKLTLHSGSCTNTRVTKVQIGKMSERMNAKALILQNVMAEELDRWQNEMASVNWDSIVRRLTEVLQS